MSAQLKTLHDTSMLAYVSCRVWSARKLDKKVTKQLTDENSATGDSARVNKYLLASADDKLRDIQRVARKARDLLIDRSLPWDDAGNRLVSNADTFPLIGELHVVEQEFNTAVEVFIAEYPRLRALALQALGDMADEADYPDVDTVRTKFAIKSTLSPLPAGFSDERVGLSPEQQEALRAHYEAQAAERYEDALTAAWSRLRDNVARYVDRLSLTEDGKTKAFQSSMVEQMRDTMALMSNLNVFSGSPELKRLQFQIEETLCKHDPETLRNSLTASRETLTAASTVLDRLNAMLR